MKERTRAFLSGGFWAGFIGYLTVVVIVALFNLAAGRSPFYTAALFGNALVFGETDPGSLVITAAPVLAFNMIHLVVFLVLGFIASLCVIVGEQYPVGQYALFAALLLVGLHLYAGLVLFGLPLLGSTAWWQVGVSGAAAAGTMGWYLLRVHPVLRRELSELQWGETPS